MKKILALVVAFALCFTAVAGCITTSAEDAAAPAIEISSVELANTAGATSFTVSGTNCSTIAAQKLTVTIEAGVTFDGIVGLINAANVATGEDADYYVETVEGNTVVTLVSVLNIGAANDTFTYTFNVTVPENNGETAVDYDVTAATVAGSIDEEYINVEIAPATITVAAKAAAPAEPKLEEGFNFSIVGAYIADTLGINYLLRINTFTTNYPDYKSLELVVTPQKYNSKTYMEDTGATVVVPFEVDPTNTKYYSAKFTGVAMYELGLNVSAYVKFYDAEGNYVAKSTTFDNSVADLLKSTFSTNPTTDYLKKANTIITDMLNMGAQAQIYFPKTISSTTCDLYNADLITKDFVSEWGSTELPTFNDVDTPENTSDTWDYTNNRMGKGVSLLATPAPSYMVRSNSSYPLDKSKLTLTLSYRTFYNAVDTVNGDLVTDVVTADKWVQEGNWISCSSSKVAMYDLNKTFTATISYDGEDIYTHTYSVESFIGANLGNTTNGMGDLLRSIGLFSASARAYFDTI